VSAPVILALIVRSASCFSAISGCPCRFSLMAGLFIGALLTDISLARSFQKIFDGMDSTRCWRFRFPAGRRAHEFGKRRGADRQFVASLVPLRGPVAGRRRLQHVLFEMSGSTTADVAVMSARWAAR